MRLNKILVILPVYNTAEQAQVLIDGLRERVKLPYDLAVIDNGCAERLPFAQARIDINVGMGGAVWYAIDWFGGPEYDYYWILSTSLSFQAERHNDPLQELLAVFQADPACVGVGPSWSGRIDCWPHRYHAVVASQPQPMIDTAALWDRRWFERVGLGFRAGGKGPVGEKAAVGVQAGGDAADRGRNVCKRAERRPAGVPGPGPARDDQCVRAQVRPGLGELADGMVHE